MPKNSLVTDDELTSFSEEERKAFISGKKPKSNPEPIKKVEPVVEPAKPKNEHDPDEKPTEQFLLRLNKYQLQLLEDAFDNSKHRSKQKLIQSILLPELHKLADYK
ncbi:hypothetical protein KCM76_22545 [Zooshikella marina]|uniref:hypothetical protein n=1 Tax=Zooshikella ganghwensis TaxID=202772 RepID=UPI001BB05C27|nr:hypothetical protein [Zooshikella ganghwensis]MBU2708790.1 hypothetical protein [Zooshikella ganghwensis]